MLVPDVSFDSHTAVLQGRVYCDVYRVVGRFSWIVVVNQGRMGCDARSSRPPSDDRFLRIHFPVQVKHVFGEIQFDGNLLHRFIVRDTETVGDFDSICVRSTWIVG